MKHPHAESMALYAQDALETATPWERWERNTDNEIWNKCHDNPQWHARTKYRRKPAKRYCNGTELPACDGNELSVRTRYYSPDFTVGSMVTTRSWGYRPKVDEQLLKHGQVYLNEEDALTHAKAMLITWSEP